MAIVCLAFDMRTAATIEYQLLAEQTVLVESSADDLFTSNVTNLMPDTESKL